MQQYFVVSEGQEPIAIKFRFDEAAQCGSQYIDVFDDRGIKIETWYRKGNFLYRQEVK